MPPKAKKRTRRQSTVEPGDGIIAASTSSLAPAATKASNASHPPDAAQHDEVESQTKRSLLSTTEGKERVNSDSDLEEGQVMSSEDKRSSPTATASEPHSMNEVVSKKAATIKAPGQTPAWTSQEKTEAMRIIREIVSLGMEPAQLVHQGIRQDIVLACCQELGLPFHTTQSSSLMGSASQSIASAVQPRSLAASTTSHVPGAIQSPLPANLPAKPSWTKTVPTKSQQAQPQLTDDAQRRAKKREKERKRKERKKGLLSDTTSSETNQEIPVQPIVIDLCSSDDGPSSQPSLDTDQARNQLKKPMLGLAPSLPSFAAREEIDSVSSALSASESQLLPESVLSSNGSSSMDTMRRAALASMKRKKSTTFPSADSVQSVPSSLIGQFHNVPRGPKASKPHYHDIDAPPPQTSELEEGEWEEEEDVSLLPSNRVSDEVVADPRQAKRAKFSYSDDYSWDVDAPSGDVDLEAPLPSLAAKPISRPTKQAFSADISARPGTKRRLNATDLMDLSGASTPEYQAPIRQKPFLPNNDARQRLVVEYSDDEDESEGDVRGLTRQASTKFITHIYKQLNGSEEEVESSKANSPRLQSLGVNKSATQRKVSPSASSSATSTLSRKEEEIREMMARIQELERKRGLAPSEPQVLADAARVTLAAVAVDEDEKSGQGKAQVVGFRLTILARLDREVASCVDNSLTHHSDTVHMQQQQQQQQQEVPVEAPKAQAMIPAYISPFSQYPNLRQTLRKK